MNKTKNIFTLFFVSILVFVFMLLPSLENFLENKIILDNKKEELHAQEQYFNELREIDSVIERYSSRLELINLAITDETIAPSLIYYAKNLSQDNGLFFESVNSVSKNPSTRYNDLNEVNLSFTVVGDYFDFKNFIQSMEKSIKTIEVENVLISFDFEEEAEEERITSYDVLIKTYYY